MSMVVFYLVVSMSFYAGTRYEQVKQKTETSTRTIGLDK